MEHILLRTDIQRYPEVMMSLQVERLRATDATHIVGQPNHRRWCEQLRCIEDPGHLLRMVREGQSW